MESDSITEEQINEIVLCVKGQNQAAANDAAKPVIVWEQTKTPKPSTGAAASGLTLLIPGVSLDNGGATANGDDNNNINKGGIANNNNIDNNNTNIGLTAEKAKERMKNGVEEMDTNEVAGTAGDGSVAAFTSTQRSEATHNSIGDSQFHMTQDSTPSQIPSSQPGVSSKKSGTSKEEEVEDEEDDIFGQDISFTGAHNSTAHQDDPAGSKEMRAGDGVVLEEADPAGSTTSGAGTGLSSGEDSGIALTERLFGPIPKGLPRPVRPTGLTQPPDSQDGLPSQVAHTTTTCMPLPDRGATTPALNLQPIHPQGQRLDNGSFRNPMPPVTALFDVAAAQQGKQTAGSSDRTRVSAERMAPKEMQKTTTKENEEKEEGPTNLKTKRNGNE